MAKKIAIILVVFILSMLGGCTTNQIDQQTNSASSAIPSATSTQDNSPKEIKEPTNVLEATTEIKENKDIPAQQEVEFSDEDLKVFKLIQKYYKGFNYSNTYLSTSDNQKKMVFTKQDNLYFDIYGSYNVIYDSDYKIINYFFEAGHADFGYGSYYVIDDNTVINIEKSAGISAYNYEIYKNGKKIDGESKNYDFYSK